MSDYTDPIGQGGLWLKEGKKGKFFSGEMTFSYNGHEVTAKVLIFRNERKTGQQPDYVVKVIDAFPAKPKDNGKAKAKDEEDIPF